MFLKDSTASKGISGKQPSNGEILLQERLSTGQTVYPGVCQSPIAIPSPVTQTASEGTVFFNASGRRQTTPPSDSSSQSQITSAIDNEENGKNITIFLAYEPEDEGYRKKIMGGINALINQQCRKGRKWQNLTIRTEQYDVTTDLGTVTDTANSTDPLQPFQLILWLLSPAFVGNSNFCYSEQTAPIFVNPQAEKRLLLCILLHVSILEGYPFDIIDEALKNSSHPCPYRYLPSDRTPVSDWKGNRTEYNALHEIFKGIEKAINDLYRRL